MGLLAVFSLLLSPTATAVHRGTGQALSVADLVAGAHIQPDAVSHLLSEVERQWQEQALADLQNNNIATSSLDAMVESCSKVSKAIVSGSEGNKDKVVEYLQEVCNADAGGQDKDMCQQYATAFEAHLSDDLNANREDLNVGGFCQTFYKGPIMEAAKKQQVVLAAQKQKEEEKAAALSAEEKKAAARRAQTEAYIKEKEDTVQAQELSKAARGKLDKVNEIMARVTQNFAIVSQNIDSSMESHADTEQIVGRARQELRIANEKAEELEVEQAEAKAKAAEERLEQLRLHKATAPLEEKAVEEVKTEEKKVALLLAKTRTH